MIKIEKKEDCVGCGACEQRCPKSCISMAEDAQGFLYPIIDPEKCIDCHLCEKVCPVLHQAEPRKPINTFAAKNNDPEIQKSSSSGGVFFSLAKKIIEDGGVVFGARFNEDWEVVHAYAETIEDVRTFQGSKYVQSRGGKTFDQAEKFLKSGRKVLFSGTPCQVAGLKRYLMKDYDELLLTVEVVCHGVPSPLIWTDYLRSLTSARPVQAEKKMDCHPKLKDERFYHVSHISFRDKRVSWEKFGFSVNLTSQERCENRDTLSVDRPTREIFESHDKNIFMRGFLNNLYLRPSCYSCPSKSGKSNSDISIADFWGVKNTYKELYSRLGVSLVLTYSEPGIKNLQNLNLEITEVDSPIAVSSNPAIYKSVKKPAQYHNFWKLYQKIGLNAIIETIEKMSPNILDVYYHKVHNFLCRQLIKFKYRRN